VCKYKTAFWRPQCRAFAPSNIGAGQAVWGPASEAMMRVIGVQLVFMLFSQVVECGRPNELVANLGLLEITSSIAIDATPPGVEPWTKVELPGTQCSDGSQYKFFVSRSNVSRDLLVIFEPGGACWDFASCSGQGLRGAANPAGIPDDHMDVWQHLHPAAGGLFNPDGALAQWSKVFIPYCTGDVHVGSRVTTYQSEDGTQSLEYRHVGRDNMQVVTEWLAETFTDVPRMVVTGCSAGGTGALLHYPLLRHAMTGVQRGYLLDDSGPIFPQSGASAPLYARIQEVWNTDAIIGDYADALGEDASAQMHADFGSINTLLADAFPEDRLALVAFRRDLNYSLYSYDSFYDHPPYDTIVDLWEQDLAGLRAQFDSRPNLAYYMPFFRSDNCSHCATIIPIDHIEQVALGLRSPWSGTGIQEAGITLPTFINRLIDDQAELHSYVEQQTRDGSFSTDQIAECRQGP
jgi:hypothetical protein